MIKYEAVLVKDTDEACRIIREASRQELIQIDLEWSSSTDKTVSIQISWPYEETYKAYYLSLNHTRITGAGWCKETKDIKYEKVRLPEQCDHETVIRHFHKYIACNGELSVEGHGFRADLKELYKDFTKYGLNQDFRPLLLDTLALAVLCNIPMGSRKLKELVKKYIGYQMTMLTELAPDVTRIDEVKDDDLVAYGLDDVVYCGELSKYLQANLLTKNCYAYWTKVSSWVVKYTAHMEFWGFPVNAKIIDDLDAEYKKEYDELMAELYEKMNLPEDFNVNSNEQLSKMFFDDKKYWDADKINKGREETYGSNKNNMKRLKKGFYSTGKAILEDIPIYEGGTELGIWAAGQILDIKAIGKIRSSFSTKFNELTDDDGRLRCQFKQFGTATGRYSCAGPNLQQVSSRSERGIKLRDAFVPREGWTMLAADFSQMELRILAHIAHMVSGRTDMLQVFWDGKDPHQNTADIVGGTRSQGKTINFATVFGIGPAKLAQQLRIPIKQARQYLKKYLAGYPDVQQYIKAFREQTKKTGFVPTLYGRQRDVRHMLDFTKSMKSRYREKQYTGNIAINTPIQGTAADIVKKSMMQIYKWLSDVGYLNKYVVCLAQVHDELLFEIHPDYAQEVKDKVFEIMSTCVTLKVTMDVDGHLASSWREAH